LFFHEFSVASSVNPRLLKPGPPGCLMQMPDITKILTKIFGNRNDRLLKRLRRTVVQINAMEEKVQAMTDEEMRQRTAELRKGIAAKELRAADVLPEGFAIMRESMDRHIGIRGIFDPDNHFDPDQLDDDMLEAYDEVQRRMIATGESWRTISIPPPHLQRRPQGLPRIPASLPRSLL